MHIPAEPAERSRPGMSTEPHHGRRPAVPDGLELHLICDNYATRKTPAIKKWLLRHRRFHQQSSPCVCRSRFPAGPAG